MSVSVPAPILFPANWGGMTISAGDVRALQGIAHTLRIVGTMTLLADRIDEILALSGDQCEGCGCWPGTEYEAQCAAVGPCPSRTCYCRYCQTCHEYPCACDEDHM